MKDIEERILYVGRWEKAERNLTEFEEMMKLINQYPPKSSDPLPHDPPYEPSDHY